MLKILTDFQAVRSVVVYQYFRCGASFWKYGKFQKDTETGFQKLQEEYHNFSSFDEDCVRLFLPTFFLDSDLVLCLTSWAGADIHNFNLIKTMKQNSALTNIPVFVCGGSDKKHNGIQRKDLLCTPEDLELRQELLLEGRYIESFGGWFDPVGIQPDERNISLLLQQLLLNRS